MLSIMPIFIGIWFPPIYWIATSLRPGLEDPDFNRTLSYDEYEKLEDRITRFQQSQTGWNKFEIFFALFLVFLACTWCIVYAYVVGQGIWLGGTGTAILEFVLLYIGFVLNTILIFRDILIRYVILAIYVALVILVAFF